MADLRECDEQAPHAYHGWTEEKPSGTKYHVCPGVKEHCEATCITVGRVEKIRRCELAAAHHGAHMAHYDNGKPITWTEKETSSIR